VLDTFEIHDDEINVEEIMQKIRENIKRRKETGACQDIDDEKKNDLLIWEDEIKRDLDYINSNWDIQNNGYFISSHRPYAGKFLIKGRELVHGEVKRYVDPMIWMQKEFNASVVRILNETTKNISEIRSEISDNVDKQIGLVKTEIGGKVDEQIGLVRSEINNEISTQVRAIVAAMNQEIENKAWLANILDKKIGKNQNIETSVPTQESGLNYFLFEEQFRGSREDIKEKQTAFVQYFKGYKNVLDIGCGRGEFLELLKKQGIDGKGVDIDENMVNFCKSKGIDVELIDAISYLETVEDKSLDGIFIDQVVEHLESDYLIKMIGICYKKLIYGGILIAETVNPLSFASFANFYIDLSHKRPIHPETLKFILGAAGFRDMEMKYLAPVTEDLRLRRIDTEHGNEKDKRLIEIYNHNMDIINNVLFGAQDYAVIGRK
jgi:2-polyprenyl-3-methyl-5-hydroxy-6-metoxy-1,4-benzoquinol methylase